MDGDWRIRRPAYTAFLVAYVALFASQIAAPAVALLHILLSASRLADAGFNYKRSLWVIAALNLGIPILIFYCGEWYVEQLPPQDNPYAIFIIFYWGVTSLLVVQFLISMFCLRYPSFPRTQGPMHQFAPDGRRLWVDTANEP